ncbi:MAG: DUF3048 domain-containing protein [Clostridiales bacterium]|nr:DUF3048 domain-containing protein [Clostridiales bacterium]
MKRAIAFFLTLALLFCLAACAGSDTDTSDDTSTDIVSAEEDDAQEAANNAAAEAAASDEEQEADETEDAAVDMSDWEGLNPLTGEATETDVSANRPVMVMLNNLKQALPQSGNSQADIIYEMLEEGGITRMLAVYQDISSVEGNLGTIRSTRPYYVDLVAGLDGILVHAGGSNAAYEQIASLGVTDLDALSGGASTLFWRDKTRLAAGVATERTMYITASDIADYLASSSLRTEHEEGFSMQQSFVEDGTPSDGSAATVITVPFSGYKTGEFTYDSASGKYLVSEYGSAYVDGATGEQVSVTNVIIIMTNISTIEGDSKGRISVTMTGSGIGYYACGGKYIPINWSRASEDSQYQFTTMSGEQLQLGVGKSYINIVPTTCAISFVG